MEKDKEKITIDIKGTTMSLSLDELNNLEKQIKNARNELLEKTAEEYYKKIASSSLEEIKRFINERTRIATNMDYLTNGGYDDQVIYLIHFLSTEKIKNLSNELSGLYLDEANTVLQSRGEEQIIKKAYSPKK